MIEIYLFINPLGELSLEAEEKILEISDVLKHKLHFRFIPIVNIRMIHEYMKVIGVNSNDVLMRNALLEKCYSIALDVKAIQLQGRKKGRGFLLALQEKLIRENQNYSKELVLSIVKEIGGNLELFKADRESEVIRHNFRSDQQVAHEMKVTKIPSAVVFNYLKEDNEDAILFDTDISVLMEQYLRSVHVLHSDKIMPFPRQENFQREKFKLIK
jgi:predicted DsbA family dithiol-disulfide isomerase